MCEEIKVGDLFDRAIELENIAKHVYLEIARKFSDSSEIYKLWNRLADDEETHAKELRKVKNLLNPEQLMMIAEPEIVKKVEEVEKIKVKSKVDNVSTLIEAYELAHDFENSEINKIFEFLTTNSIPGEKRKEFVISEIKYHLEHLNEIGKVIKSNR